MAAKDYKILPALFNAYIGKISKRHPEQMTDDRRIIPETEILALIDWYVDNKCHEDKEFEDGIYTKSFIKEGYYVKLSYVKESEENK